MSETLLKDKLLVYFDKLSVDKQERVVAMVQEMLHKQQTGNEDVKNAGEIEELGRS